MKTPEKLDNKYLWNSDTWRCKLCGRNNQPNEKQCICYQSFEQRQKEKP